MSGKVTTPKILSAFPEIRTISDAKKRQYKQLIGTLPENIEIKFFDSEKSNGKLDAGEWLMFDHEGKRHIVYSGHADENFTSASGKFNSAQVHYSSNNIFIPIQIGDLETFSGQVYNKNKMYHFVLDLQSSSAKKLNTDKQTATAAQTQQKFGQAATPQRQLPKIPNGRKVPDLPGRQKTIKTQSAVAASSTAPAAGETKKTSSETKSEQPAAQTIVLSKAAIDDTNFTNIMTTVFSLEGGFVNDKDDNGGKTNFGITEIKLKEYCQRHGLTAPDIANLTQDQAKQIYYDDFYIGLGADKITDKNMRLLFVDTAINNGPAYAKKILQAASTTEDGITKYDIAKFLQLRTQRYAELVKNPKMAKYKDGWNNRMKKLRALVNPYEHYVSSGETGGAIAKMYNMQFSELEKLNPKITNWRTIKPDDKIKLKNQKAALK